MSNNVVSRQSMGAFDYRDLFSSDRAQYALSRRFSDDIRIVKDRSGHSVRNSTSQEKCHVEYCSFDDQVLLVASDIPAGLSGRSQQMISDGDWLHIQFRLAGGGSEICHGFGEHATPAGACIVSRHPDGTKATRDFAPNESWKAVCLYIRPSSFSQFFDLSQASLPPQLRWLSAAGAINERMTIPVDASCRSVAREILTTRLDGALRRTYLKGKIFELFALTVDKLSHHLANTVYVPSIDASEVRKLNELTEIMNHNLGEPATLRNLARKVGTNRTRLAEIFKECNGVGVQEHWRRMRLQHAADLLSRERLPVTEVAMRIGYANVSSLSRAFLREFGVLPKDMRARRKQSAT